MTFWSKVTLSTARPLDRFLWSEIVLSDVRENIHFVEMKTHVSTVIQNKKSLFILNHRWKKHFSPLIFIFFEFFQISHIVYEGGRYIIHLPS